jgi:hypothetical protein
MQVLGDGGPAIPLGGIAFKRWWMLSASKARGCERPERCACMGQCMDVAEGRRVLKRLAGKSSSTMAFQSAFCICLEGLPSLRSPRGGQCCRHQLPKRHSASLCGSDLFHVHPEANHCWSLSHSARMPCQRVLMTPIDGRRYSGLATCTFITSVSASPTVCVASIPLPL